METLIRAEPFEALINQFCLKRLALVINQVIDTYS